MVSVTTATAASARQPIRSADGAALDSPRMAKTLLTGATGLHRSHVARALVERGDDLRVTVRETARTRGAIDDLDVERVSATSSTAARCGGR